MIRADGEPLDVPIANQALPRPRLGEAAPLAQRLDELGQLRGGRHVPDQDSARQESALDHVENLPWGQHVKDYPVEPRLITARHVTDAKRPVRRDRTEERLDVATGDFG